MILKSDLAFAQFIGRSEATPWKAQKEKFGPSAQARFEREYDEATERNLQFLRGQIVAETIIEQRNAA